MDAGIHVVFGAICPTSGRRRMKEQIVIVDFILRCE